jgi:hypothetical protein
VPETASSQARPGGVPDLTIAAVIVKGVTAGAYASSGRNLAGVRCDIALRNCIKYDASFEIKVTNGPGIIPARPVTLAFSIRPVFGPGDYGPSTPFPVKHSDGAGIAAGSYKIYKPNYQLIAWPGMWAAGRTSVCGGPTGGGGCCTEKRYCYELTIIVDEANRVTESDESNNTYRFLANIKPGRACLGEGC